MSVTESVNILMVDDQPGKLLSYQAILEDLGENLLCATSGKQALELLLSRDVAIILMDVSMPELDGFELADLIRQHPRFQKTAIIFISAVHLTDLDRMKGYQRGAMDYISVPVVPELLRAKVSVFADLYRKTRELELLNRELEKRVLARTEQLRESEEQVRRLNDQLQQRVAELETIMKVLPVGVSIAHDPHCRFVTGNAELKELLELGHRENLSPHSYENNEETYEVYQNGVQLSFDELPLQRAAATGKPVGRVELEIRSASGNVIQTLMSANPLFYDSGNVRGAVGALIDITERKRMEQTLRQRADLLDLASEAIMVRDLNGTVQFWNPGATAALWLETRRSSREEPSPTAEYAISRARSGDRVNHLRGEAMGRKPGSIYKGWARDRRCLPQDSSTRWKQTTCRPGDLPGYHCEIAGRGSTSQIRETRRDGENGGNCRA